MVWGWRSEVPLVLFSSAQVNHKWQVKTPGYKCGFFKSFSFAFFNSCICPVKGVGVNIVFFLLLCPYSSLPMCRNSCPVGWWESIQVNIDHLFLCSDSAKRHFSTFHLNCSPALKWISYWGVSLGEKSLHLWMKRAFKIDIEFLISYPQNPITIFLSSLVPKQQEMCGGRKRR